MKIWLRLEQRISHLLFKLKIENENLPFLGGFSFVEYFRKFIFFSEFVEDFIPFL